MPKTRVQRVIALGEGNPEDTPLRNFASPALGSRRPRAMAEWLLIGRARARPVAALAISSSRRRRPRAGSS